jgi:hypothetical protein
MGGLGKISVVRGACYVKRGFVDRVQYIQFSRFRHSASSGLARTWGVVKLNLDGEDDVVALFVEFQDELDVRDFIGHAEIDSRRGAEKIHRFEGISVPRINVFEI